jgi:hypothetical protein
LNLGINELNGIPFHARKEGKVVDLQRKDTSNGEVTDEVFFYQSRSTLIDLNSKTYKAELMY